MYATNVAFIARALFAIANKFNDEFTRSKLLVYGGSFAEDMKKSIDPDNLQQCFGGNLPDKTENFFPP